MSPTTIIFKKIADLEKQVQELKIQAYFDLSKKQRPASPYFETTITKALKATRNQIWQQKYAKKIEGVS